MYSRVRDFALPMIRVLPATRRAAWRELPRRLYEAINSRYVGRTAARKNRARMRIRAR